MPKDSTNVEEQIQLLQNQLDQWVFQFKEMNSNQVPKPEDFTEECKKIQLEILNLMISNSEPPTAFGCHHFIKRKRRYCSRKATVNEQFCSLHRDLDNGDIVESSRLINLQAISENGKKTNLKKPPKRMLNPFVVNELLQRPDWESIFDQINRPLCLDIGCAKGAFIEQLRTSSRLAIQHPNPIWGNERWNFVGVELFGALAEAANQLEQERRLKRQKTDDFTRDLYYIGTNINVNIESLQFPNLKRVTFMFPDPWSCGDSNNKNKKRRVMTEKFAIQIAKLLPPGGDIYFASDWHELALDIRTCLLKTNCFELPKAKTLVLKPSGHVCPWPWVPTKSAKAIQQQSEKLKDGLAEKRLIDTQKNRP
ncbi:putative methyltransferase-domain-containing protein, partial [Globomyces pollinis-pini]